MVPEGTSHKVPPDGWDWFTRAYGGMWWLKREGRWTPAVVSVLGCLVIGVWLVEGLVPSELVEVVEARIGEAVVLGRPECPPQGRRPGKARATVARRCRATPPSLGWNQSSGGRRSLEETAGRERPERRPRGGVEAANASLMKGLSRKVLGEEEVLNKGECRHAVNDDSGGARH